MNATRTRVLLLSALVVGGLAFSTLVLSTTASAAGIAGTWVSRIPGEGYIQSYMGPSGSTVTEYFDIELVLSGSESSYTGTVTATGYGNTDSYSVWGTFDGTKFLMTADYGWDGVNYLTPTYTLTVEGDEMYGSGSYLNVGVTIFGTFDLKKEGLFGVGGIAPLVSAGTIAIAITAIIIAATPGKAPKTGYQPQTARAPSLPPRYEPSPQWTTEVPSGPISGNGTTPVGGVGLGPGQPHVPPPPTGRPAPPREHFSRVSQEPPRCPFHSGVALTPHYSADVNDHGSWYCPSCKGYPWGKG